MRALEASHGDFMSWHKAAQVDVARLIGRKSLEFVVGDDDVTPFFDLEPAHDMFTRHRFANFAMGWAVELPAQRLPLRAQRAERKALCAGCRIQLYGDADESKTNGSRPQRPRATRHLFIIILRQLFCSSPA